MFIPPACELKPLPIDWLWSGYRANGSLAMLDGDPGLGKSLLMIDLAARLTTGRAWPDGAPSPGPASALFLCDEDADSIVVERLRRAEADMARVFLWPRLTDGGLPRLPTEVNRLDEALKQTAAKLVIIDPIMAFWDRGVEVNAGPANRDRSGPRAS